MQLSKLQQSRRRQKLKFPDNRMAYVAACSLHLQVLILAMFNALKNNMTRTVLIHVIIAAIFTLLGGISYAKSFKQNVRIIQHLNTGVPSTPDLAIY